MPPATTSACDVNGSQSIQNVVTCDAARHFGSTFEQGERFEQRALINCNLSIAEIVSGVFQDLSKIFLNFSAKTDPP